MSEQEPQKHDGGSGLASFGEDLRKEREIRGISLREIADATKISKRFLEALERNDHKTLPAPVFTRGFVREYAKYVGLNAEELVNRYNFAAADDDRIEKPPTVAKYPQTPVKDISPKPPPKRGIPSGPRVDRNVITALLMIAALTVVAWWAVQYKKRERELEISARVPLRQAKPALPVTPPPEPPVALVDDAVLRLTVHATARSWVTLEADGRTVLNAEMDAGERQAFDASEQFRFRTVGNAAGLSLTLNGTKVPRMGDVGEVVKNRVYDREALNRIRATAGRGEP